MTAPYQNAGRVKNVGWDLSLGHSNSIAEIDYDVRFNLSDVPAIGQGGQDELREAVRHERRVELAFEGFRFFDMRRWRIAEEAMNGPAVGRPKGVYTTQGTPAFSKNGVPDYSGYLDEMRVLETRQFEAGRDYLWPIPQSEMDVNPELEQNPGY